MVQGALQASGPAPSRRLPAGGPGSGPGACGGGYQRVARERGRRAAGRRVRERGAAAPRGAARGHGSGGRWSCRSLGCGSARPASLPPALAGGAMARALRSGRDQPPPGVERSAAAPHPPARAAKRRRPGATLEIGRHRGRARGVRSRAGDGPASPGGVAGVCRWRVPGAGPGAGAARLVCRPARRRDGLRRRRVSRREDARARARSSAGGRGGREPAPGGAPRAAISGAPAVAESTRSWRTRAGRRSGRSVRCCSMRRVSAPAPSRGIRMRE